MRFVPLGVVSVSICHHDDDMGGAVPEMDTIILSPLKGGELREGKKSVNDSLQQVTP
jgi:hypothetical protein